MINHQTGLHAQESGATPTRPFDAEREFMELLTEVTRLRQEIAQGKAASTAGLYNRVDALCQIATSLPPQEARKVAWGMGRAIAALDEIEDLISARFSLQSPRTGPRQNITPLE